MTLDEKLLLIECNVWDEFGEGWVSLVAREARREIKRLQCEILARRRVKTERQRRWRARQKQLWGGKS